MSKVLEQAILAWANEHKNLPVRWILGKNLHITLVPPWAEDNVDDIISRLKKAEAGGFDVKFDNISLGPNGNEPRLIWAKGQTPKELLDLRLKIYDSLGGQLESRPFRLHLTLARFRSEDFENFPVKILNESVNWPMRAERFVLYESHLSPDGADYEVLAEFLLQ